MCTYESSMLNLRSEVGKKWFYQKKNLPQSKCNLKVARRIEGIVKSMQKQVKDRISRYSNDHFWEKHGKNYQVDFRKLIECGFVVS